MYEDGVMIDSSLGGGGNGQPAGSFYLESGETDNIFGPIVVAQGTILTVEYVSGSWDSENSYILTNNDGIEFLNETASSSSSVILELPLVGSDSDDSDASVH